MLEGFSWVLSLWLMVSNLLFPETGYFLGGANWAVQDLLFPAMEQRLAYDGQQVVNAVSANTKKEIVKGPRLVGEEQAPTLEAASAFVTDFSSGQALFEQAPDHLQPIASITKLMTALVFLDHNPGWDKVYKVAESDKRDGGKINFFANDEVKVKDLFMAMLVASDNAAVISLIKSAGFSEAEFVAAMNEKAAALGLKQTTFKDPTGLHNGNLSTAREVAMIAKAALAKPEIQEAVLSDDYSFVTASGDKRHITNTDKLLAGRGQDMRIYGGKTGYLVQAGYCFVGRFGKQNKDVVAVALGTATPSARFTETKKMVNWVFDNYIWLE